MVSQDSSKLISIRNYSAFVKKNNKQILKNIYLDINKSEIISIVGCSGAGKSFVANSIIQLNRELLNENKISQTGEIIFNERNIIDLKRAELQKIRGKEISIIFQEPCSSFNPVKRVFTQIFETIRIHNLSLTNKEIVAKIFKLIDKMHAEDLKRKIYLYPHELSGGQVQRMMILMAIANKPKLIIADEPTTSLDQISSNNILKTLLLLREEYGISILFITHNIKAASMISDRICVMRNGEICEINTTHEILNNPTTDYSKLLIKSAFTKRNIIKKIDQREELLSVDKLTVKIDSGIFSFFRKEDNRNIIENISFKIYKGCTLGIIGDSGSGKSSIVKAIIGLHKYEGNVLLHGQPISNRAQRQVIQIVMQDSLSSLNPKIIILESIKEIVYAYMPEITKDKAMQLINDKIAEVGLGVDILYKHPEQCSGGERQRISIARALILTPKIIILDEPTSSLDVVTENKIIELLVKLQEIYNISYILISHNIDIIKSISHQIAIIKSGKIVEINKTEIICSNPQSKYSKQILSDGQLN